MGIRCAGVFSFAVVCLLFRSNEAFGQIPQDSSAARQDTVKIDTDTAKAKHFEPVTDRWREIQPPDYELNVEGHWYDPYNRNVLKGDYPIVGQNTFLVLTLALDNLLETTRLPTPSGVSTERSPSQEFFGRSERFAAIESFKLTLELYHGDVAFRPRDWEIRVTPVFNLNYVDTRERNAVNINVRKGSNRTDSHIAFQELSLEKHLFNVSDRYDFVSLRGGIQRFSSDFRGFIFNDFNLGARLFGTFNSNRWQYNLAYFRMLEKDTNSELNTVFENREQDVFIANLYRQDFITLGYTAQLSFHYNHDKPSLHFDENGFPVRPAVLGNTRPHDLKAYYLGWTGDGHFGRLNISHALYQVVGTDDFNSAAGRPIDLNAQMAALELSVDKDWMRFRVSGFYSSGDADPMDDVGRGFDTIVDQPFFAGGPFSFWNSQAIRLLGVNLVNKLSLVPDLRSSKLEGQANFVNPGLLLFNLGYDAEITPKVKAVTNVNYVRFADTAVLESFLNQPALGSDIGLDYSLGVLYRPFLNNNAVFTLAAAGLTPFGGFKEIYESPSTLFSFFGSFIFTY